TISARIAAIACVAGTDWLEEPMAESPLSLLYITGTADPLNPIDGGEIFIGQTSFGMKPPVRESIREWVQMLDCPADSNVIRDTDGVLGLAYGPCRQDSEVAFYTIEGMGHFWPGGMSFLPEEIVGQPSDKIQATDVIWEFFQKHVKM
ncbi:MAG: alpha/beta hydrolase family esterase, partial [bacterium]